jgi:hypothetical protein
VKWKDINYFFKENLQIKNPEQVGIILFICYDYSFDAKYLSASKAAIQPVPAAVIACR